MGAKIRAEMSPKKIVGLCFFVTTDGNETISVVAHKKNTDLELFTPFEALYKTRL